MKAQMMLRINKSKTEEELIKACLDGKASAQRSLYERMSPKMLGICIRYIKDQDEAEHVMIGSMVKVFEKLEQYKGDGSFEGWVRRILVNDCLMYIRKNRNMSLEVDIETATETLQDDLSENMLEAEDLLKMIGELPVGYGTVFNLYAIEGYSHADISKMLGISENTSKSQLSRARKWLQSKLVEVDREIAKQTSHGSKEN